MWYAPPFDTTPYSLKVQRLVKDRFYKGVAGAYSPQDLVKAGVFTNYPMRGGIFVRRARVKHIIVHSTETAREADGPRVIRSWSNMGFSHPGTQYVVDRNGLIYQTVDPKYGTTHVNSAITLRGVNNDNSIGIEIVRAGKQKYTGKQLASVAGLVDYLKERFEVTSVYGHGQIQPKTRTDPVAFNWGAFNKRLAALAAPSRKGDNGPAIATTGVSGKAPATAERRLQAKPDKRAKPAEPRETAYTEWGNTIELVAQLAAVLLRLY